MANEDKATRYHRLQRRASLAGAAGSVLFFLLLWVSGGAAALRDVAAAIGGGAFLSTVLVYALLLGLLHELVQLPAAYYQGVTLERRYDLSTQSIGSWWRDYLKANAISLALAAGGALTIWSLIAWSPDWWWLAAAALFALFLVAAVQLMPVLFLPLFFDVTPLAREALVERLLALARRAGTPVLGVFEWRLSDRTRKANAALAGLGRTRRILLSDTLLAEHTDDEIEVILAHELSHHVHHDLWAAIALESGLLVAGFYLADRALEALGGTFGLAGKADVAALPLLLLAFAAVSLPLLPLANALSRAHERRADRYALRLTGNVEAFVSAMRRLAARNLAEEEPPRWVEALFHSHPSTRARIAAAEAWARRG